MPTLYMTIPAPTRLLNRGQEIEGDNGRFDTAELLEKVYDHPKWMQGYKAMVAMAAIKAAWSRRMETYWALADSDHVELADALRKPAQVLMTEQGPRVVPGWAMHPRFADQVLPYIRAILEASETPPAESPPEAAA